MVELPANVRQVLKQLVPASVLIDITCYVLYDNHPRDNKNIDVILCTKIGEVKEFYQRDLVSSVKIDNLKVASEIRIVRNSNCDLFYLVFADEDVTILSRKEKLLVHQIVTGVDRYDINDISCSGQACLRVFRKGEAVPLIFEDDLKTFQSPDISMACESGTRANDESLPIITHLMRKLTEAKYSVKCTEKTHKDFLDIHKAVAFSTYKKIHPNLNDSMFKDGLEEISSALKINTCTPWIKVCNKKIVISLNVCNLNNEPLADVQMFLHGTTECSMEYTTKLFEETTAPYFWEEAHTQILKPNVNTAIVVVIDLEDLKSNIASRIELNGVIFYRRMGKEYVLPVDEVKLSSLDTMGKEFDVLACETMDANIMLAILASTEKTDLILRHIKRQNDEDLTVDTFCKYLQMEKVSNSNNVAIHKMSPYHVLNGVMVILHSETVDENDTLSLSVYSRTPPQVLALIHYMHDAVPLSIVITTPNYKITAKDDALSKYNEEILGDTQLLYNYENYATSILNRTSLVLKYFDHCMVKMSESKNPLVQSKIGSEIDLIAGGETSYLEFKSKMREEAAKCVKTINDVQLDATFDEMCID